uniref:RNAse L inhibitor protein, putative n=1 Tax=Theileria annulata TaxID=5874 RepID=A0A3B0NJZ5_THEAN
MLAGKLQPDNADYEDLMPKLSVSYKPQKLSVKFDGTLRQLFHSKIRESFLSPIFQADVVKPMQIDNILDQQLKNLSGGELQRAAIILVLGTPADIYLIDEPSAYLDSEQRIVASRVIKRITATALSPEPLATGFNRFLKSLDVTFRRDPTNFRPRINKYDSVKDKEQKACGLYFTMDT